MPNYPDLRLQQGVGPWGWGTAVDGMYLDLNKAFLTVSHGVLMGTPGGLLQMRPLEDGGTPCSSAAQCQTGRGPQGSVLGSVLLTHDLEQGVFVHFVNRQMSPS